MTDNPGENVIETLDANHLKTLYDFSLNMNSSLDFYTVLDNFVDSVMDITNAQRAFVMIDEKRTGELKVIVARGGDEGNLSEEAYSTTIVNEVVRTRSPLLTNNAQFDDRYEPGKSIIMRKLRAILCAPMIVQDRLIGAVYVDTAMRSGAFTENDLGLLNAVCGLAGTAIENARLYQVAVEKGRLDHELQMALEIQQSLLPERMPQVAGYEVAARWQAAREVAGDFYDAFVLPSGELGIVIADVSDKGAPAAMFMAVARTMIRSHAFAGGSAVETLSQTNDLILEDTSSDMFVTAFHSVFRAEGKSVHVNAGHNPTILYRERSQQIGYLDRGGRAIGWFPGNPLHAQELELESGDLLLYYTDGLTEAENADGDYFGEERLLDAVVDFSNLSVEALCDAILDRVDGFIDGNPPHDDLTMVAVRYTGR